MGIEKLLGKIYYDPKEGFMGVNNLFMKAGAKDKVEKLVDVKKWSRNNTYCKFTLASLKKLNTYHIPASI